MGPAASLAGLALRSNGPGDHAFEAESPFDDAMRCAVGYVSCLHLWCCGRLQLQGCQAYYSPQLAKDTCHGLPGSDQRSPGTRPRALLAASALAVYIYI